MPTVCTFHLDSQLFGLEVATVQEVMQARRLTSVPHADSACAGLMNLRGQIVPAIDLRKRLDLPPRPADKDPMYTVAYTHEGAVALIVDEIGDVIEVPAELSSAPETLHPATRSILHGIYKLPRALLLMVNIERVLAP